MSSRQQMVFKISEIFDSSHNKLRVYLCCVLGKNRKLCMGDCLSVLQRELEL